VTRALEDDLTKRLPGIVIARSVPSGQPARALLITVDAFDIMPDGRCVLAARWSVCCRFDLFRGHRRLA